MEDGLGQQTCVEKHLTAAYCCIYLASGGFGPRPPLGLRLWTLLGGSSAPRPSVPILTSEPAYATGICSVCGYLGVNWVPYIFEALRLSA